MSGISPDKAARMIDDSNAYVTTLDATECLSLIAGVLQGTQITLMGQITSGEQQSPEERAVLLLMNSIAEKAMKRAAMLLALPVMPDANDLSHMLAERARAPF